MRDAAKIALFDLDDTLADYVVAMQARLQTLGMSLPANRNEYTPTVDVARKLIQNQPGFWRQLPKRQAGFKILDMTLQVGFSPMILTQGPMSSTNAWTEKVDWCLQHVPEIPVTITRNKSLVYGRVLVDDFPDYFLAWLNVRPRGIVICPQQPWNRDVQHPRVTIYDGTNDTEVVEKLIAAYQR